MFFALLRRRRNTEDKVTENFFMADEFHKVFWRLLDKYSLSVPKIQERGHITEQDVSLFLRL